MFILNTVFFQTLAGLLALTSSTEEWNPLDEYPHVVLSNGNIEMSVFLPDAVKGFYRNTRFDWSGIVWQLAFVPDAGLTNLPEEVSVMEGNRLVYLKDVPKSFLLKLSGFGDSPSDGRVVIENTNTGAGVEVGGDFPLYGFNLYTSTRSVCPELFAKIDVKPGETQQCTRTYRFFSK